MKDRKRVRVTISVNEEELHWWRLHLMNIDEETDWYSFFEKMDKTLQRSSERNFGKYVHTKTWDEIADDVLERKHSLWELLAGL